MFNSVRLNSVLSHYLYFQGCQMNIHCEPLEGENLTGFWFNTQYTVHKLQMLACTCCILNIPECADPTELVWPYMMLIITYICINKITFKKVVWMGVDALGLGLSKPKEKKRYTHLTECFTLQTRNLDYQSFPLNRCTMFVAQEATAVDVS